MSGTTTTQANAEGIVRRASGVITAGTTATDLTITLGWQPKYFMLMGLVNLIKQEWYEGMNQGDVIETAANGTVSLETSDDIIVGDQFETDPAAVQPGNVFIDVSVTPIVDDNDGAIWVAEG